MKYLTTPNLPETFVKVAIVDSRAEEEIKELWVPLHLSYSDSLDKDTSFVLYLNRFSGQLINKV